VEDDLLYGWSTNFLNVSETYVIKLEVNGASQKSVDILLINLADPDQDFIILAPEVVDENEYFTVEIKNTDYELTKTFVLLIVPGRFIGIKYGDTVEFKAPRIFRPLVQDVKAKIIAFKIIGLKTATEEITIKNTGFSFGSR
jgi:hypothetical protein